MDLHLALENYSVDSDDVLVDSENMAFVDGSDVDVDGYGDYLVAVETYHRFVDAVVAVAGVAAVERVVGDVVHCELEGTEAAMIRLLLHDSRVVYCCYADFLVHIPTLDHSLIWHAGGH